MAEGDNVADIGSAPFPMGANSTVLVRLGGHVIEGAAADTVVDAFTVPWDCYVRKVCYTYTKTSTNDLDGIKLVTVDAAKDLVAAGDMSANLVSVAQTLDSDVAKDVYQINKGDKIVLKADAAGTTEGGIIHADIWLRPVYAGAENLGEL